MVLFMLFLGQDSQSAYYSLEQGARMYLDSILMNEVKICFDFFDGKNVLI